MTHVKQVGGDHYAATYQHWDLMEDCDVGYLEGNATAYIRRYSLKGTAVLDMEKAISFLEKMGGRAARRLVPREAFTRYVAANPSLDTDQMHMSRLILCQGQPVHISMALDHLRGLLKFAKLKEKRSAAPSDPY